MNVDGKIKVVNSMTCPTPNGVSSFFIDTTKEFLEQGCEVLAIFPLINSRVLEELGRINDKNLTIAPVSRNKFKIVFQEWKLTHKFKPNLIFNHDLNRFYFYIAKILKIPVFCHIFGCGETKFHKFKNFINFVFAAKQHQIQAIREYSGRINVCYFPYCINFKDSAVNKVKHNLFTIGCLGWFENRKGFEQAILAAEILQKRGMKFQLLIGGDGLIRKKLENLVEEKQLGDVCKFVGVVKNKAKFYNGLDLFCFTSWEEDVGLIVPEAISYGVPVVGNDVGFVSDLLDDNDMLVLRAEDIDDPEKYFRNGKYIKVWWALDNSNYRFKTKPLAPEVLADGIEYAMKNYDDMVSRTRNAYRKLNNNYSIEKSIRKVLDIYRNVM
ncbi:MAG: glycosyltransferase [Rickettsiales bacterium]|jgi:glycosyltransferase involved in cell wall biosynthesis|nr:glycosyltransferase [Rickettsiales bacterium]